MHTVEIPPAWLTVLDALRSRNVQFLVSGSAADAIVEGNPDTASVLVVAPSPFRRNLERLARALEDLGAKLRATDGRHELPVDLERIVHHPALRWRLTAAGVPLDVIGSAVGDGEFSIRVWRTRPVTLTSDGHSLQCEVEYADEFAHSPSPA